jgi:hypothetical protein
MKTFKEFIKEAFDKPYPYRLKYKPSVEEYEAVLKLKDGSKLVIYISKQIESRKTYWVVDFLRDGKMGVTGGGDQMRIFATVISVIEEFIKKESADEIRFSAEKSDDEDEKGVKVGSREKLYTRLVKRFSDRMGYKSKQKTDSLQTKFILTKK